MGGVLGVIIEIVIELIKMVWEGFCILSRALLSAIAETPTKKVVVQSAASNYNVTAKRPLSITKQSLPKLPVPTLKETTDKFLQTVRPLFNDDEFRRSEKLISDFLKPDSNAHRLQALLEKRAENTDNWLTDWWKNVAYLDWRMPSCGHVNPGVFMPFHDFRGHQAQIMAAAKVVTGVLDFKQILDSGKLETEKMGGQPICMDQYNYLLSTCRIPGRHRDSVINFQPDHPNAPDHITVIRNNHFFSMPVYGAGGQPLSTNQIIKQLNRIVEESQKPAPPVGILTSDHRDHWAEAYEKMNQDAQNKANFEDIQRSIFVLCLDKAAPHSNKMDLISTYLNQCHTGGGSTSNTGNRWHDKPLQIIVGPEGFVGGNSDHTTAEGPPVVYVLDYITLNYLKKDVLPTQQDANDVRSPTPLKFNITPDVGKMIEISEHNADDTVKDINLVGFVFNEFGKNFIKSQKMSPDAFIQVAFQLAFYKLYGYSIASYESGSLRRFKRGRTDTIRSCSIASHAYCQAMQNGNSSVSEKAAKLKEAVASHRKYTDEVVQGKGIDRHLLGLKLIAKENDIAIPAFLTDPLTDRSCTWRISTSQVASRAGGVLCFGPVVNDGYGICYSPMDDEIFIALSTWNSSNQTSTPQMQKSITEALIDAKNILLQSQKT